MYRIYYYIFVPYNVDSAKENINSQERGGGGGHDDEGVGQSQRAGRLSNFREKLAQSIDDDDGEGVGTDDVSPCHVPRCQRQQHHTVLLLVKLFQLNQASDVVSV